MSLLDEFKVYCRDKGKYNLTDFNEIVRMFAEFEADRRAKKGFGYNEESSSENHIESELTEDDNDAYFGNLFGNLARY